LQLIDQADLPTLKARYDNKEYVITQPIDEYMYFTDVREVLFAELKLLAQCDGIKQKFDEFIEESSVEGVPGNIL
jgi:hypothetical protein